MIGEITNHLWQSTIFALAVAMLALAFRKNRAEVRYWLWLSASLKFLVPFSLLIGVGLRVWDALPAGKIATHIAAPIVSQTMVEITQPFPETFAQISSAHHTTNWIPIAIVTLWAFGFFCVAVMRCHSWFRIRAAVRASTPINIAATIPVRSSATLLEPGVIGFLRPVLLLPEGILKQLTPPQLEAVLAHEQCHVRRRDNLTSALHMLVEAIFWFHPAVWWIGAKLVEERERACDEAVLKLGSEPQIYAEGILNVCKSYLESPLRCVSGITGSDLKKRIRAILTDRVGCDLNFRRKVALAITAMAAFAIPILVGLVDAPTIRAQSTAQSSTTAIAAFEYEVASIKPDKTSGGNVNIRTPEDGLTISNFSLGRLIQLAFGVPEYQISGAPEWANSENYDIDAKMDGATADALKKLSADDRRLARQHMLQALLIARFKLIFHRDSKELPVYWLSIAKNGPKIHVAKPGDTYANGIPVPAGRGGAGVMMMTGGVGTQTVTAQAVPIGNLLRTLATAVGRPVLDKTALTGLYDFTLTYAPDPSQLQGLSGGAPGAQPADTESPSIFTAVQEQLGLKLDSGKGPVEIIVVDHVERPSGN
jgi:bla regulator protein blaR1